MKRIIATLLFIILLLSASGCSQEKKIVLASKPMTEQFIIAEMIIELIKQETDITVEYIEGVGGGTSNIHPGMISGEIDIYPEYTGTGWMEVLKNDLINDPNELYEQVKDAYKEEFNIYWSELYGFNDTYGIAIKKELSETMGITTYSDLAKISDQLKFGAEHDFYERSDGMPGLKDVYGFEFEEEVGMDIGLKYEAIDSGSVDIINIFSTDGKLEEYNLVVLEDDLMYFPSYYAATLIRMEILELYPELEEVLSKLDNLITNEEMTYMNYLVEIENQEPKDVAIDFLQEKGILN